MLRQGVHGSPLFSVVGLYSVASTCWKWIRPLELDFATVDRMLGVSFLFLFCLTESETTDSVPSDEENAEVSVFWIFSTLEQGFKNSVPLFDLQLHLPVQYLF